MDGPRLAAFLAASYLVGAVPFGLIVGKAWRGVDVREYGSRNIGFSNVLRTLGWGPALVVFAADLGKGLLPVLGAKAMLVPAEAAGTAQGAWWVVATGACAILGHSFSVFLCFRGGRGVTTSLGVLLGLCWQAGVAAFGVWVLLVAVWRYISLGSMVAAVCVPAFMLLLGQPTGFVAFGALVAVVVLVRHLPNLGRLLAGTEAKFGERVELTPQADHHDR